MLHRQYYVLNPPKLICTFSMDGTDGYTNKSKGSIKWKEFYIIDLVYFAHPSVHSHCDLVYIHPFLMRHVVIVFFNYLYITTSHMTIHMLTSFIIQESKFEWPKRAIKPCCICNHSGYVMGSKWHESLECRCVHKVTS